MIVKYILYIFKMWFFVPNHVGYVALHDYQTLEIECPKVLGDTA